jgi:hypothetical protein
MDKLVELVKDKAGISQEQAQKAVETVTSFLKEKLPSSMSGQLDSFIGGNGSDNSSGDSLKDKMGGIFGK